MECKFCPNAKLNPGMPISDCCCCNDAYEALQCCCSLCGCGSEQVPNLLMEVLEWCNLEHGPERDKVDQGCYSSPAWELAAKVLDDNNFVEHGTGIGWPWTTVKGKEFLEWAKDNQPTEQPK